MPEPTSTTQNPFDEPRIIPDSDEVFETYRMQIITGAVLLIVAIVGGTGWWVWKHSRETQAMASYHAAMTPDTLAELASSSPNTAAGGFALLLVARDHQEAGRWDDAFQAYKDFVAYHPKNPLTPTADLGAARALESLERYPEAINAYQAMVSASPSHPFAPAAHIGLGRVYQATSQQDAAREILASLIASNSSSIFLGEAEDLLNRLAIPSSDTTASPPGPSSE